MFWHHLDDIAALIIVIGCLAAIFCKIDGHAWSLLGAAAAWCFRSGLESRSNGNKFNNKKKKKEEVRK